MQTFRQIRSFSGGPGVFDPSTKTLSFDVFSLQPNETRTFTFTAKTAVSNDLPADQMTTCLVNQAQATADNGQTSQDNAQFCIEKPAVTQAVPGSKGGQPVAVTTKGGLKVFPNQPVKTTPSTGPEAFALLGSLASGIAGLILRKKTSK